MKFLAATSNPGKLREFHRILEPLGIQVLSPKELGLAVEVEETAGTFEGNARLKAEAYFSASGMPTLADDSGLCIDALGGAPGVYSARFEGEDTPYPVKMQKILDLMQGKTGEERSARFVCALVCVLGPGRELCAVESCEGYVGEKIEGARGFGYDPIFVEKETGKSFASLSDEEKDRHSHRGKSLRKMQRLLWEELGQR